MSFYAQHAPLCGWHKCLPCSCGLVVAKDHAEPFHASRSSILTAARDCALRDRAATHGAPEDSFATIAGYWSTHTGTNITATDVSIMLALLKVARLKANPDHLDNWIDLAGYAACGGEIASKAAGK